MSFLIPRMASTRGVAQTGTMHQVIWTKVVSCTETQLQNFKKKELNYAMSKDEKDKKDQEEPKKISRSELLWKLKKRQNMYKQIGTNDRFINKKEIYDYDK